MAFSTDVIGIICDYLPEYKLLEWIDINKINWSYLSRNPAAIELLKEHSDRIDWLYLSENPAIFKQVRNMDIYNKLLEI